MPSYMSTKKKYSDFDLYYFDMFLTEFVFQSLFVSHIYGERTKLELLSYQHSSHR